MSKLEFKPEDFIAAVRGDYVMASKEEAIARLANRRLVEMLASATVVYKGKGMTWPEHWTDNMPIENRTHKALLFQIEELPKAECKHEPESYGLGHHILYKCKHCKIELVVKWVAK